MTLNPDVYKKAQEVIDDQIGGDRLIEPSDRENLPYITCLLKEVFRYVHPITDVLRADWVFLLDGASPCHWVSSVFQKMTGPAQKAKVCRISRPKTMSTKGTLCPEARVFSSTFGR